jgi:3D (Asp-Asp-Asp) domain-containing protein
MLGILLLLLSQAARAATWEQELGADYQREILVARETLRPRRRHRPFGGTSHGVEDDYVQRTAKELMKTVLPVSRWRKGEPIGRFIDTYYFNVLESDYPGPQTVALKDGRGRLIAMVAEGFWRHLRVEGSGRLRDGRQVNTSESGFTVVDAPMGEGNCPLVPWRTIAVDHRVIPLGTIVKIDETVGLKLPDGAVSDGVWQAEDTGGEVRNAQVDLYVGDGEATGKRLDDAGIHLKALTLRWLETPPATCARP